MTVRPLPAVVLSLTIALLATGCGDQINFGPRAAPTPGAVTGMDHILLSVSDLDRSVAFYHDTLGMDLRARFHHFAVLRAGDYGVILSTQPWDFEKKGDPKGVGMIPHFTTPDMDAFAARMKAHGVPWLREPHKESFGMEAFITDPDGYQWAILAPVK